MASPGSPFGTWNSSRSGGSWFSPNAGSKSSQYAATALKLAASHQAGHHSAVGGFIAHLAHDVVDTATGLPAGLLHTATTNPLTTAKEIYQVEKTTWAPLLTGDYQKFVHNFYEHPLGPILDVAGVLTGGAGLAAKTGLIGKLGVGAERSLQVGGKVETVGRYSDNPVIRMRQRAFDHITDSSHRISFPKSTPLMGESARATRALQRIGDSGLAAHTRVADTYNLAAHKLNKSWQHTAYMTFSNGQAPSELLRDTERQVQKHNDTIGKQVANVEKGLSATGEKLTANSKAIDLHNEASDAINSAKDRKAWEVQNRKLEHERDKLTATHDALTQKHTDLHDQYSEVEQITRQVLGDPKAEALFHEAQAAHAELRNLGYDVPGETRVRIGDVIDQVPMSKDARKILVARDAARDAANLDGDLRKLPEAQREMRRYLHPLLRRGATFEPDNLALIENSKGVVRLGQVMPSGKVQLVSRGRVSAVSARVAKDKIVKLDQHEAQAYLDEMFPMDSPGVSRSLYHKDGIDKLLAKVKDVHAATGRAEPVYFPDKMMIQNPTRVRGNKFKGKNGALQAQSLKNHQNLGALYMSGVINTDPLVLAQQTMADIMVAHAADIADLLRQHAETHVGPTPKGYVELKGQAVMRNYMNEALPRFRSEMAQHIKDGSEPGMLRSLLNNHIVSDPLEGGTGHKLIVPKKMIDGLIPEWKKSSTFANAFYNTPQSIWKHIVLAGRPLPFITNNIVGNTVMYGLQHSGPEGVRALVRSRNEERTFEELAPEHHLTFGQAHSVKRPGRIAKAVNIAYHAVGANEHLLRRASFVAKARSLPQVKRHLADLKAAGYKASENDGKSLLHAALEKADVSHPGTLKQLGEHIDDVMGNYRRYSKGEEAIRKMMPFYSWNRHAARAYYRVLTDKPLTAALVTHVGQMGSDQQQKLFGDVPAFMKQYLPAGALKAIGYGDKSGHMPVINASVLNPESTVADEVKLASALISGKPGEASSDLTSNLSPLITAPIEAATGKSLFTGAPIPKNFLTGKGALGSVIGNTAVSLPIPKLIASLEPGNLPGSAARNPNDKSSQFTPTGKPRAPHQSTISHDAITQLLNTILGVPAKDVNVKAAQNWQKTIEGKQAAQQFHVAKKRKSTKKSSTAFGKWTK